MGYLVVEDFRGGVDRRRPIHVGKPGTLWSCVNAHITMGGDIEKRKAFVDLGDFSSDTFGLFSVGDFLYTFGSVVTPTLPGGVRYQRLTYVGATMTALLDADLFDGKIYAIARFADDSVQHFYDGVLVGDWNNGVVRAYMGSLNGMATSLAAHINTSANYDATAVGNVITIIAVNLDQPFTPSTFVANVPGGVDDQVMVYVQTVPSSPGVAQQGTLTLAGTFEPGDRFGVTLTTGSPTVTVEYFGNVALPWGNATCVKTHKRKEYVGAAGSILDFSKVNDPTRWNSDVDAGAGFLNASNHDGGSEAINSLEVYQGRLAIFSRRAIQLWTMQNDDDLNALEQVLRNTGTRSPHSTLEFAGNDVFYLDDVGIRSIRARDASNNAFASGVGGAVNKVVREWMKTGASPAEVVNARAVVEPEEARFWMAIGSRIFVYSYFPETQVAAWSWYEPGFTVTDFAVTNSSIWARADDTLYLYGGPSGSQYGADYTVTVEMPFTSARKPGTTKALDGMDIAAEGSWACQWRVNPNNLDELIQMGTNVGVTFPEANWQGLGEVTHVAPVLTNTEAGYASLSQLALYYQGGEEST